MKRTRIAQAEGVDWNELRRYVTKYRSIDHATTKMREKLPELHADFRLDLETRDRDTEEKAKTKAHADKAMNAKPSHIQVGDRVLVRQEKKDKFSTPFNPTPFDYLNSIVELPKVPAWVHCSMSSIHQSCSTSLNNIFLTRIAMLTILSYI